MSKKFSFIERFSGVFLIAGVFFFGVATLSLGIIPALMVDKMNPRQGLPEAIPANMTEWYSSVDAYQKALLHGRDLYIAEACWHCHSQYVRPVSNENMYYGPVATPGEYQNALNMPQLFGTRRVGPDLSREAGKRSNDWQLAHLYQPVNVVPESVMPSYTWYFKKNEQGIPEATDDSKALVAYLQHLGHQYVDTYYEVDPQDVDLPPSE